MAQVISFREASEKARSDARTALARLREERLKARRDARPRWVPGQPEPGPEPEAAAPAIAAPDTSAPAIPAAPAPAKRSAKSMPSAPLETPAAADAPPAAPRRKTAPGPISGRGKRIADIVRDTTGGASADPAEPEASPEFSAPEINPAAMEAPEVETADAAEAEPEVMLDLSVLSILGPGLRWRLSQLGIDTLKSLSKTDAAWLRRELGEIGRLTHVEAWIEAAKAMDRPTR